MHGFMYYFSTRIQKENKKHVFDYILLFKDIIQYVQYAMPNILQKSTIIVDKMQTTIHHALDNI